MLDAKDHEVQLLFANEFVKNCLPTPAGQDAASALQHLRNISEAYIDLANQRGMPGKRRCHPSIQLACGEWFDFLEPENSPMYPADIAHALAKISRFNGHTKGLVAYTVAQHCVMGTWQAPPGQKFAFLMHDAPEYVLGDMATPLKQLCPDYHVVEARVERAMALRFNLQYPMSGAVKHVDTRMLATEQRDLMPFRDDMDVLVGGLKPYDFVITPWTFEQARDRWFEAFQTLQFEERNTYFSN